MPDRTLTETFEALGDSMLDEFDSIVREAHAKYRTYDPAILIEHDVRAQANCTYCHMVAAAERRFLDRTAIRPLEIRGLKVWLIEHARVVVRFKKMDEDGRTRNYPTKQAKKFDAQLELPGLPSKPVRLAVGYLLDATGVEVVRAQISRPDGKDPLWCGVIVPKEIRIPGERIWTDETRQRRFA
jgi:hypothetical protein